MCEEKQEGDAEMDKGRGRGKEREDESEKGREDTKEGKRRGIYTHREIGKITPWGLFGE